MRRKSPYALGLSLSGFASAILTCQGAFAQTAVSETSQTETSEAVPAAADNQLQEIVVTGQKRAAGTNVQRTSVAVTAVGSAAIEKNFITNIRDVGRIAPNVQLATSGSFASYASFFIRGIGLNSTVRTVEPAVGLFVDGTYIGYGPESLPDTFDVASIEVLRGPQGTLFGKNVIGGAVVMEHQKPTDNLEGRAQVTLGNYSRRQFAGMINVPVSETLSFRLVAVKHDRDGFWRNLTTGNRISGVDTLEVRPAVRWRPTGAIDFTLSGEYVRDKSGTVATEGQNSFNDPRLVGPNYIPTPALTQSLFNYIPPSNKYQVRETSDGGTDAWVKAVRLNGTVDLGHGTVSVLTNYRTVKFDNTTDFDGTPFPLLLFPDNHDRQSQESAEVRYASTFSRIIEFTVGGYYFKSRLLNNERRDVYAGGPANAPIISNIANLSKTRDSSLAGFVQGRLKLLEGIHLVLGGRYSDEEKRIKLCPFNAVTYADRNATCPVPILTGDLKSKGFTPKVGIDWQVNEELFGYVSATKGLRSGAWNTRAANQPSLGPARDESVWSYEAGLKSELFDRHLRLNGAVFYADYTDIQRAISQTVFVNGVPTNATFLQNAAAGRIWGAEVDASVLPLRGLQFDGSFGYTNARYKRVTGIDADRNGTYTMAVDDPLALNLRFERVPTWTYNIGGSYDADVLDWGKLTFRANYAWRASQFVDTINSPVNKVPSFGLLDASLTLALRDERYRISVFGNNLTGVKYWDLGFDGGPFRNRSGGAPRTFGVELGAKF